MDLKYSISAVLKQHANALKLILSAHNFKRDIGPPGSIPEDLQAIKALDVLDMIFDHHIEHPLVDVEW